MYNLLLGGAAGDGIETTSSLLEKTLLRSGYQVYSMRDFMSRVRGGHNFAQLRYSPEPITAHRGSLDALVAFNEESFTLHKDKLQAGGFVLCDEKLAINQPPVQNIVKIDTAGLAKQAGNPKTTGTVFIGALLRLFGLPLAHTQAVLTEGLKPQILEANLKALQLGYDAVQPHFTAENPAPQKTYNHALLTGAQAMALGAIAGGLRYYTAYPMSPSTTLLDFFTKQAAEFGLGVEQAEDEIAAINMALGASYAGARAMVGTSGGGFSLMVEALGFAGIAEIPVVMVDVQRPGPATGLPTRTEQSDLLFVISAAQGEFPRMVIAVRNHLDAFYQTARALYIAEKYQIPVILLSDQYLADSAASVPMPDAGRAAVYAEASAKMSEIPQSHENYLRYKITQDGISPLLTPGKTRGLVRIDSDEHDERGVITESAEMRNAMVEKRARKLDVLRRELIEPEYHGVAHPETLLLAFGSTAGAIQEAVTLLNRGGLPVGALCFGDIYPMPTQKLLKYAGEAKLCINVEQNSTGQLARLIRQKTGITCEKSILKYDGRQMSTDDILAGVRCILG